MQRVDTTTAIETPERVGFRFRVAGPGPRAVAWGIDLILQAILLGVLGVLAALVGVGLGAELTAGVSGGAFLLALFLVSWFYAAAFEALWAGRTPGKYVLGLRVVQDDGAPVEPRDAVLRNLLRGVDALPVGYVVGVLACVLDGRMRRLGDLVAGTMVVIERRSELLEDVRVEPPVSEEERQALPVRVDLSRQERHAIEALLRRQGRLSPARVEELAGHLAPAIAERTGVQAPTALRTLTLAWARATRRDR